jgi:hypothetical protein
VTATVLVTGSRNWRDAGAVYRAIAAAARELGPLRVVHGAQRGADACACEAARDLGYEEQPYPADWIRFGRAAGPIRNRAMFDSEEPVLVLAFGTGSGTEDAVTQATRRGIPVRRW